MEAMDVHGGPESGGEGGGSGSSWKGIGGLQQFSQGRRRAVMVN